MDTKARKIKHSTAGTASSHSELIDQVTNPHPFYKGTAEEKKAFVEKIINGIIQVKSDITAKQLEEVQLGLSTVINKKPAAIAHKQFLGIFDTCMMNSDKKSK